MNTAREQNGTATLIQYVVCATSLSVVSLIGCGGSVGLGQDCASVTVEATSDDANNDSTFGTFTANQCDLSVEDDGNGGSVLEIDILDRDAGTTNPRILFTLSADLDALSAGQTFELSRADDVSLAPAIYQEIDTTDNAGPFWSSSEGEIVFTQQDDGSVIGAFTFEADNPSSVDNSAVGTLHVEGSVTLNPQILLDTPCGVASFPASMLALLSFSVIGLRNRLRRRAQ